MPRGTPLPVMKKTPDKATVAAQNEAVNENMRRIQAIAAQARMAAEREAAEQALRQQHEEKIKEATRVSEDNQQLIDEDLHRSQIAFLNAEKKHLEMKSGAINSDVSTTSPVENSEPATSAELTNEDDANLPKPSVEEELRQSQLTFLNAEKNSEVKKDVDATMEVPSSQQVDVVDELSQIRSRINNLLNEDIAGQ